MVSISSFSLSDTAVLVNLLVTCIIGIVIVHESVTIGKRKMEKWNQELIISNNNKTVSENAIKISKKEFELKEKALESLKTETDFKIGALDRIKNSTADISKRISDNLIQDPTWLDRFMEETGMTYGGSIFGTRINHFFYEKKALAKKAIDILQDQLTTNKEMKYCLLIDSGTTTYHLFCEICDRLKDTNSPINKINSLTDRIFIITNNLPGIQYFMKHCKNEADEHSNLLIKCLLLPGKPLPVYAAVTGIETVDFLEKNHIRERIRRTLNVKNDNEYQILCFLPSNYMVRHPNKINGKELYCPVARGGGIGGHFDIKKEFADLSDKIYLISPLTKFSFATCKDLNKLNKYSIDENADPQLASVSPDAVKYRELKLTTDELIPKCNFIITDRIEGKDLFWKFAKELIKTLGESYENRVNIADYNVEQWIPVDFRDPTYKNLEMIREIPHVNLRNMYLKKKTDEKHFIWDYMWVYRDENEKFNLQSSSVIVESSDTK